ncbi:hypothetical protein PNP59_05740 [Halobacterium salinarum]|uniref:hypothetical protein n=1 Tax=Halobacterium salinarum TaxID=2242 RepID=UPI00255655A6|nr:hypothetical protein [Halobacterium salinarum]MDL0130442.1 hypothetical protein [Halobacterium salinarum]
MTRLYIVPVGEDWIDHFDATVRSETAIPEDAPPDLRRTDSARIWGTTTGRQKRGFFEEMESGDPLLFYNDGEFFASGRVGTAFESESVGESLWNNSDSRFIYTVDDFEEISVDRERIARLLDYEDAWVPYRFMRVSQDAVKSLLQEYNSVEEAFQSFQNDDEKPEPPGPTKKTDEPREHTEIQYYLVQLGLQHGYDVYVAKNDKNLEYEGEKLGENCIESLTLPGFSSAATDIIEYVDVIWLEDDFIAKLFEVESTTSIYSGILRMSDFAVKVPNIAVDMHIVAPGDDEDKVRKEITRPTFETVLGDAEHCSLGYLSFESVRETYETVQEAGPLQNVF